MAKKNSGAALEIGAGLAAAAAAAGAAYWLYGAKHSAQHRKMAKSWMLKARAEVLDQIESIKNIDKASYLRMAEGVIKKYGGKAGASAPELASMLKDLKASWSHIQSAQKSGTKAASTAKRAGKKAVKKARKAVSGKK